MCCLTLTEFRMSVNADPNASFYWYITDMNIQITNADRKSPNSLINTYICTHRSLY